MTASWKAVVTAVAVAVVAGGCEAEPPRGLNETCVECAGGSSGGEWVGVGAACTSWKHYDCVEGLYCNLGWQACLPPSPEGDFCDERIICEDGLVCGKGKPTVCERPVPRGERCTSLSTCEEGLVCNAGGVPGDPQVGTCEPPEGGVGAPCAWWVGERGASRHEGCAAGATCAPPTLPDPGAVELSEDPTRCDALRGNVNVKDQLACLGFAGTCAPGGGLGRGEACVEDAACASGRCVWVFPPARTQAMIDAGVRLVSPWPGVCAGPEDGGTESLCLASSGACDIPCDSTDDCLPGLACWHGQCGARHQVLEGKRCGEADASVWPPLDDYCALSLTCDVTTLKCRPVGPGEDGAPCEAVEACAARHSCARGTCRPYGGDGDACDAARVCEVGLRCAHEARVCEVPGPLAEGEACETHAACGAGLFCWDCTDEPTLPAGACEAPRCTPYRREGEGCPNGECAPGLECRSDPTNHLRCLWPEGAE